MAQQINDGQNAFDSRILVIAGRGSYETDDFDYNQAVTEATRTDHNNMPTGQVYQRGKWTGKCTVQLATAATAKPVFGDLFTTTPAFADEVNPFTAGGNFQFIVTKVGRAERKDGETKIPIEFTVAITNSVTVT